MEPRAERFRDMVEGHGWRGRLVPVEHIADLRHAVCGPYEQGLLDEALYREGLRFFSFDRPAEFPGARSIAVVAVPAPQVRLHFTWRGRRTPVIVPPTYVGYAKRTAAVLAVLGAWLEGEGHRLTKAMLPLKTLAVRSGLAEYGRNNIVYVQGMGSFLQLVGAFTDLPGDGDPWREPKALDRCGACVACLRHCPTGAITEARFLLHAEECLTYHNESAGELPGWIDPAWHHCLVGCLRCQAVCPENGAFRDRFEEGAEFTEEETALLAGRVPLERLPAGTAAKVAGLEIHEAFPILCRNLSLLLGRESC